MKKFENNSDKQRKLYDLINSWFDYSELEIIEESLFEYYKNKFEKENDKVMQILDCQILDEYWPFNNLSIDIHDEILHSGSSNKEIKDKKEKETTKLKKFYDDLLNKVLFKTQCLFIVNFSIEWEKKISEILFLCGFIKYEESINIEYRKVSELIKDKFKILFESEVYKKIKIMRKVAIEIKHYRLDDHQIINKYLEKLLDIQFDIIDKHQIHNFENNPIFSPNPFKKNRENYYLSERYKLNTISITGNRNQVKKYMKDENKIDISYIIKNFRLDINDDWIFEEFSFNKKESNWIETKYSINPTHSITFSEEEKEKEIKKIEEIYKQK